MRTIHIPREERASFQQRLAELERTFSYPLGADSFTLDHGPDYFAFFDRLGEVAYHAVLDGAVLVGVACGVLRRVPDREGGPQRSAWYLCDLKVLPSYRGRRLPERLLLHRILCNYLKCRRGYGITMNPSQGDNRVVRLAGRMRRPVQLGSSAELRIYSLDSEGMRAAAPAIVAHRGPIGYLSLAGKKDLVLGSTGARMPLLHVQAGPCGATAGTFAEPRPGHTHMFCAPGGDALARACEEAGIQPAATAAIVSRGMEGSDWRFVLTSDI